MNILSSLKPFLNLLALGVGLYLLVVIGVYFGQRALLFHPTHEVAPTPLTQWVVNGSVIGYAREATQPKRIWLMTHGNAGQAAHRDYVLPRMADWDSLYVLEYPGFGLRAGSPSLESMNLAAAEAYRILRARFPGKPVCVIGESLGSGPACVLAAEKNPPDKIVLVVPFDNLPSVAADQMRYVPARWLLKDRWDNCRALKGYQGPVDIFGARFDSIIPAAHAESLARCVPQARFIMIETGHNEWSGSSAVKIE